jgi:hypothetical protein
MIRLPSLRSRTSDRKPRRRAQLTVEALEERLVPTSMAAVYAPPPGAGVPQYSFLIAPPANVKAGTTVSVGVIELENGAIPRGSGPSSATLTASMGGKTFFDQNIALTGHGSGSAMVTFSTPGTVTFEASATINVPYGSGDRAITITGEDSIVVGSNSSVSGPGTSNGAANALLTGAGQTAAALNMAQVPAPGNSVLSTSHTTSADHVGETISAQDKLWASLADPAAFDAL